MRRVKFTFYYYGPSVSYEQLAVLLSVPDTGPGAGYCDGSFHGFLRCLRTNAAGILT
jgi:hypothetical protein